PPYQKLPRGVQNPKISPKLLFAYIIIKTNIYQISESQFNQSHHKLHHIVTTSTGHLVTSLQHPLITKSFYHNVTIFSFPTSISLMRFKFFNRNILSYFF